MDRVRRRYFLSVAGALLAAPLTAEAQQPAKTARIGSLVVDRAGTPRGTGAFLRALYLGTLASLMP